MLAPTLRTCLAVAATSAALAATSGFTPRARADTSDRETARSEPLVSGGRIPRDSAALIGAGFYLAGRTSHERVKPDGVHEVDEAFYIARLERSGLRQVLREQDPGGARRGGIGMVWVTPTTLVTSDYGAAAGDRGAFSIISLAGAAPRIEATVLGDADWNLSPAELKTGLDNVAVPVLTRTREVWLAMCMQRHHGKCDRTRYLRVFGGARAISDTKPAGVVSGRVASEFLRHSPDNARPDVSGGEDILAGLPKLSTPAGMSVTLRKPRPNERAGGFECSAPSGAHTSPEDDVARDPQIPTRPEQVRWVVTKPAIFAVSGIAFDPTGTAFEYVEYYRACADRQLGGFRALRPRIWAENVAVDHPSKRWTHREWRISIDDIAIGTVAGDPIQLAIAPL